MRLDPDHPALDARILEGMRVIEADAGTGKTWTLSALVVRAIVERALPVGALLVITFTRAAAAELESRIRDRLAVAAEALEATAAGSSVRTGDPFLEAWLPTVAAPQQAALRLRLAIARLEEATLSTIHGFAERVLREHAFTVSAPVHPAAGDPRRRWLEVGFDEAWASAVVDAPGQARRRLRAAGVTHARVRGLVERLCAHPQAQPLPTDDGWAGLLDEIDVARRAVVEAACAEGDEVIDWLAKDTSRRRTPRSQGTQHVRGWIETLRALDALATDGKQVASALEGLRAGGNKPMPACSLARFVLFDRCEAMLAALARSNALAPRVALACWRRIAERRFALRDAHGGGGFDDGLERIDAALADPERGPALAAALAARWRVVFVDECQDTDPLQARVLAAAFGDGRASMVLVGDPKQSIYRFRGADLHAYLSLRDRAAAVLRLGENQRADERVLQAISRVFARDEAFVEQGIAFRAPQPGQRPRARLAGPVPAPMTVVRVPGTEDAEDEVTQDAAQTGGDPAGTMNSAEAGDDAQEADGTLPVGGDPPALRAVADAMAGEIARLLVAGLHFEPASPGATLDRPAALQPADIAVLVATHAQGGIVRRALARRGIGATEVTRDHVTHAREARDLGLWLAALASPGDARRVRAALACASFGLPADAVAACLEGEAFRAATAGLVAAREHWSRRGPLGAVRQWMRDAGVFERLAGIVDGERRLTNLLHLLELLAADPSAAVSPARALQWLRETAVRPEVDTELLELRLESDARLVRIVTLHKSKGLEFPIVFVPFAFEARRIDPRVPRVFHRPDGTAVLDLAVDRDARPHDAQAGIREAWAEQVRLLYVALTRARHALYVGWGPTPAARIAPLAWLWHGVDAVALATTTIASRGRWDVAQFDAELAAHERAAGGAIRVVALDMLAADATAAAAAHAAAESPGTLLARNVVLTLPAPWRRMSFTAWMQGAERDAPAEREADHDLHAAALPPDDARGNPTTATDDVRHRLPGGAETGIALHAILEHAVPGAPITPEAAARHLRAAGLGAEPARAAAVAEWIETVRDWPLPVTGGTGDAGTWTERGLAPGRHRREWAFDLATGLGPVDADRLCAAAARAGPLPAGLALGRWRGFLRGVIDLVAEVDGRYLIVDWKSNRLGDAPEAYRETALAASMRDSGYVLQGCLYAVALHRHLRATWPGYDPRRHFGGVHYVYLRGLASGAPASNGVWTLAIDAAVLDALDAALGAPTEVAA